LKSFSLTSFRLTNLYEDLLVPMIRRMINLEDLKLDLILSRRGDRCMDAGKLSDHLLDHLSQLRRFTFDMRSLSGECTNHSSPPSSVLNQQSFCGKRYEQAVAMVHENAGCMNENVCRIYSLPYDFEYFFDLNHRFGGGPFQKVRLVTMCDEHPFEEALFRLISRDMPLLEQLMIMNDVPPKNKRCSLTPLVFARLEKVDLEGAHDDYAELFLSKRRSFSPRLKSLRIGDELLRRMKTGLYSDSAHIDLDGVLVRGAWRRS
jgi:hypothetical protein